MNVVVKGVQRVCTQPPQLSPATPFNFCQQPLSFLRGYLHHLSTHTRTSMGSENSTVSSVVKIAVGQMTSTASIDDNLNTCDEYAQVRVI